MQNKLCKKCRVSGEKLFLKGEKCFFSKCPFMRRSYGPGQHGITSVKRRTSDYGEQLKEKQKVKNIYNIREVQFRNYFKKAFKMPGITGENLLKFLELRLDNVVFRLGFANSRREARQIVSHSHIKVNNRKVNIPSFQVKKGDIISFSEKFKKSQKFELLLEKIKSYKTPSWLKLDPVKAQGEVLSEPKREDIDANINENIIVEFYSR